MGNSKKSASAKERLFLRQGPPESRKPGNQPQKKKKKANLKLHAFVAYAIEAREYWTQDDEKNDVYLGHHEMVAAVDIFLNKLEMDDMASAREAYLTRPKEARWVLNSRTGGQSTVTDNVKGYDGSANDGGGADEDNGGENAEDDQMADSDEENPEGEGIEEIEQLQSRQAVCENEEMQNVTEEMAGGIAGQNGEGMEFGGNMMEEALAPVESEEIECHHRGHAVNEKEEMRDVT
ncbi:hypothetical protein GE09DRAFT_1209584 [Coniochaeta sp. 2T2.1]|nr:hypothetical protein GE09DRAFT_1209584 [Coniochaeta sp. 2T2.1]